MNLGFSFFFHTILEICKNTDEDEAIYRSYQNDSSKRLVYCDIVYKY